MVASTSANMPLLISRSAANEAFRDALRLFVGRGRQYSVKQLSKGTGISDRMIESFMAQVGSTDYRKPDIEELMTLQLFLGPDFTTEMQTPTHQGAYWLPEADPTPPGEMAADLTEGAGAVARAVAGGDFSPEARHQLRPVGRRLMSVGASLAMPARRMAA